VGSSKDVKLKSVRTTHTVDLFVSRLHPHTAEGELTECVESLAAANDVPISDLQFVNFKHRFEGLYCSFYVTFHVDANLLSRAVELYMSNNYCPMKYLSNDITSPTRKPCCRKETARCRSCSFRFNVRRWHSLQVSE